MKIEGKISGVVFQVEGSDDLIQSTLQTMRQFFGAEPVVEVESPCNEPVKKPQRKARTDGK